MVGCSIAWRISAGPEPGTTNSTLPAWPAVTTFENIPRFSWRPVDRAAGRITCSMRSSVGIGIGLFLRCRHQRTHDIPSGPMNSVPWVRRSGIPGAVPLSQQLTCLTSPPAIAATSASTSLLPDAIGSRITSTGCRSTSNIVLLPPARRGSPTRFSSVHTTSP